MSGRSSSLDSAVDSEDHETVRSLLQAGERFSESQWTMLADHVDEEMLRLAIQLSGQPPARSVGHALVVAANGGQLGLHTADEAAALCRVLTEGLDAIGADFAASIARTYGADAVRVARTTYSPSSRDAPLKPCPEVVQLLVAWVQRHGVKVQ